MKKYYYLIEGDVIPENAEIRIMGEWLPITEFISGQRIDTPVGCIGDFLFRQPSRSLKQI